MSRRTSLLILMLLPALALAAVEQSVLFVGNSHTKIDAAEMIRVSTGS